MCSSTAVLEFGQLFSATLECSRISEKHWVQLRSALVIFKSRMNSQSSNSARGHQLDSPSTVIFQQLFFVNELLIINYMNVSRGCRVPSKVFLTAKHLTVFGFFRISFSHVPQRERVHSLVAEACWWIHIRRHVSLKLARAIVRPCKFHSGCHSRKCQC